MARGWESKSVEDQISARMDQAREPIGPRVTAGERDRVAKREGLLLSRIRTLNALQTACDKRYRAHLELVLADLDARIAALDSH